jgi:hypothetical protein
MKNWVFLPLLTLFSLTSEGQESQKNVQSKWQQEVQYSIEVGLDDEKHILDGFISIKYINNSPDDLKNIYFHLWPNAYKNRETAFARQFRENGSTDFEYAKDSQLGFIDQLDFKSKGLKLKWKYDLEHIDIAVVELTTALKPGEQVQISTPFRVKLPGSFSRLGHEGQSYQITQWYPKPAVYDVNGWNAMPYLNQGEFYSEFGSFDVAITLPENYFVAATGVLQNDQEWKRIKERESNPRINSEITPTSSSTKKTLNFKQENVHDFAWFADKRFNITSSQVKLASGRIVKTYTYDPAISNMVKYVDEAVLYYSEHIGEYPYDYCTAVRGQLEAGGGMEYPMVTVIGTFNEEVIVHEVGHNWFYGILGSDERSFPWMDESINSFFEMETIQSAKQKLTPVAVLSPRNGIRENLDNINDFAMELLAHQAERTHTHQSINCHSTDLTNGNYGVMVYGKGSLVFKHLKSYLGDELFYTCFKDYYANWKFKHPLPGDMEASFEATSKKNLDWFFKEILGSEEHLSFSIEKKQSTVVIKNTGGIKCPIPLSFAQKGIVKESIWIEPFQGQVTIDIPDGMEYDQIKIDAYQVMFENNRNDNSVYLDISKPKKLKLGIGLEDPELKKINWLPLIGFNNYDKTMLGVAFHNIGFPSKNTEFILAPMFGTESSELTGYASIKHTNYLKSGNLHRIEAGIQSSRFSFVNPMDFRPYTYQKVNPYLRFHLKKPFARSKLIRSFGINYNLQFFDAQFDVKALQELMATRTQTDTSGRIWRFEPRSNQHLVSVDYSHANKRTINPFSFKVKAEYGMSSMVYTNGDFASDDFLKLNANLDYFVSYPIKKKGLKISAFVGAFLMEADNSIYHYRISSEGGKWDYAKEHALMGRGASEGLFANQVVPINGNLKNAGVLSNVNSWMAAVNLESGLPFKVPLGVYMDVFTFKDFADITQAGSNGDNYGYTGGVYLDFGEFLKIYVPLFDSKFLEDIYKIQDRTELSDRIVFSLNLNLFNLLEFKNKLNESSLF